MRILVSSHHRYPARNYPVSNGGLGGARVTDCIVKGLAELGEQVFYLLEKGAEEPLPPGVQPVDERIYDVDIFHVQEGNLTQPVEVGDKPWVRTCHVDLDVRGQDRSIAVDNWIYVSQTLARTYGRDRYVLNGIDPAEFIYSEQKSDYFLFMCHLDRALRKGLETALSLSEKMNLELVIAGSAVNQELMEMIVEMCRKKRVHLVGEAQGAKRAELLAGARALLFPTTINESFGLVMAEALMSGTPVIASDKGACPELISKDVGFICQSEEDYIEAVSRIDEISPQACREKALRDFHYLRMAREYVREYERELS